MLAKQEICLQNICGGSNNRSTEVDHAWKDSKFIYVCCEMSTVDTSGRNSDIPVISD
jgi:hypothetical protein